MLLLLSCRPTPDLQLGGKLHYGTRFCPVTFARMCPDAQRPHLLLRPIGVIRYSLTRLRVALEGLASGLLVIIHWRRVLIDLLSAATNSPYQSRASVSYNSNGRTHPGWRGSAH